MGAHPSQKKFFTQLIGNLFLFTICFAPKTDKVLKGGLSVKLT